MFLIKMCAGSAEKYNDKNNMIHNPTSRCLDITIEVYLLQECECVISISSYLIYI